MHVNSVRVSRPALIVGYTHALFNLSNEAASAGIACNVIPYRILAKLQVSALTIDCVYSIQVDRFATLVPVACYMWARGVRQNRWEVSPVHIAQLGLTRVDVPMFW